MIAARSGAATWVTVKLRCCAPRAPAGEAPPSTVAGRREPPPDPESLIAAAISSLGLDHGDHLHPAFGGDSRAAW